MVDGEHINVDAVLVSLGKYGRWQIYQCILLCVTFIPTAFQYASIVFMGHVPSFMCNNSTTGRPPFPFLSNYTSVQNTTPFHENEKERWGETRKCEMWDLTTNSSRPCETSFLYGSSRQSSIVGEWDLVCRWEYLVPLSQMILTVGIALGNTTLLPLADRYGRKRTLVVCHWIYLVISMLLALSPNISTFIVGRFLIGLLHPALYSLASVTIMEIFPEKQMTSVAMSSKNVWAVGIMLMCPIAYLCRDVSWRYLQVALSMSSVIVVALQTILMVEPIRWLFAVDRKKEAVVLIRKAAKVNKVNYEEELQDLVEEINFHNYEIELENLHGETKHPEESSQSGNRGVIQYGMGSLCGTMGDGKDSTKVTARLTVSKQFNSVPLNINNDTDEYDRIALPGSVEDHQINQRRGVIPTTIDTGHSVDSQIYPGNPHAVDVEKSLKGAEVAVMGNGQDCQHNDTNITEAEDDSDVINEGDTDRNAEPDALLDGQQNTSKTKVVKVNSMLILFRLRRLRMLTASVSFIWTADCLVYYGLLLLSPALAGNRFVNVCLNGAIEIPGYLLAMYTLKKFKRKTCTLWFHVFTGWMLASATIVSVSKGPDILVTALTTLGKLGGASVSSVTLLYGSEVFPTSIRGSAVGLCNAISYAGTILSPLANYLAQFGLWIPTSVFVMLCVAVCILLKFMPETRGRQLPQTIADL